MNIPTKINAIANGHMENRRGCAWVGGRRPDAHVSMSPNKRSSLEASCVCHNCNKTNA